MQIEELLERDIVSIAPEATLGDLVEAIKASKRNLFAVVAEGRVFNGLITLDDVREIMFRQDLYDTIQVRQLMKVPAATAQIKRHDAIGDEPPFPTRPIPSRPTPYQGPRSAGQSRPR